MPDHFTCPSCGGLVKPDPTILVVSAANPAGKPPLRCENCRELWERRVPVDEPALEGIQNPHGKVEKP